MTYHTYNPSTDTLEVGTKIRLAGREGEIIGESSMESYFPFYVRWSDGTTQWISLAMFPALEIADKPVKPLTIDKRVKMNIEGICDDIPVHFASAILDYLNSLEEV